jgi:hypothetical protein
MKRLVPLILALIGALCGSTAALAQSTANQSPFALSVGVGSNGVLVEGAFKLNNQLVLRAQASALDFNYGFKSQDIAYDGRFHFNTGGGFVDWHLASNPWLITAGAVDGQRDVKVSAKPSMTGSITIHGVTYPVSEIGSVVGKIDYGNAAPVVGAGWDNTFYGHHGWGFRAIAGVQFGEHPPQTRIHAIGPYATQPTVIANVQADQATLQHDAADFSYYPVAQIGVNYRF